MHQHFPELETKRCFGHRGSTTAVAWNLTGSRLLAAGDASTILLYDSARLEASTRPETNVINHCRGHTKNIEVLLTSTTTPDMFVSAGLDSLINVFDTRVNERPLQTINAESRCLFADWAPGGNMLAVGVASNKVLFVDCLTWSVRDTLEFDGEVNQFRWSTDGGRLLFTRGNGNIDMYSWPGLKLIHSVRGHVHACVDMAIHPKGGMFAVASLDTCVSVWEERSLTCNLVVDRWERRMQQCEYSHDGSILAVVGDYERIDLIDSKNGAQVHTIPTVAVLNNMAFHPSRLLLAFGTVKARDRYNAEVPQATYVWGYPRGK